MLYIVATPIGNLLDFSYRAVEILRQVDLIVAEDTRRSQILLNHYGINNKIISLHEHNETKVVDELIELLNRGKKLALISDAGTPLISDPGYHLVKKAHAAKIIVSPIPGASALIAAISVCGLANDRFKFMGFLPHKLAAKQEVLVNCQHESSTMVFFESPHRLIVTLKLMVEIFGPEREMTFCRELTKQFETIIKGSVRAIYELVNREQNHQTKGEIVLVVAGAEVEVSHEIINPEIHKMLEELVKELPLTKATKVLAKITGINRQELYDYWLSIYNK